MAILESCYCPRAARVAVIKAIDKSKSQLLQGSIQHLIFIEVSETEEMPPPMSSDDNPVLDEVT